MDPKWGLGFALATFVSYGGCADRATPSVNAQKKTDSGTTPADTIRIAPDVAQRLRQFPPTVIDFDRSLLDPNETEVVTKLIDASREIDEIFWRQVSEDNPALRDRLARHVSQTPADRPAFDYFEIMYGPWDRLKGNEPFIGSAPKPPGAGFYPPDLTKDEWERWLSAHPEDRESFQDLVKLIRREGTRLKPCRTRAHMPIGFLAPRIDCVRPHKRRATFRCANT